MTLVIEIPPDLEHELSVEAAKLGLPLPEYALRLLSTRQDIPVLPQTGAELVAYWQDAGVVGTRSDIDDSQAYARKLRREAESRSVVYL